jgi:ribonuclease D
LFPTYQTRKRVKWLHNNLKQTPRARPGALFDMQIEAANFRFGQEALYASLLKFL